MVLFRTSTIAQYFAAKSTISVARIRIEGYLIASAARVGTKAEAVEATNNRHGYRQRRAITTNRINLRNPLQAYGTLFYRILVVDDKEVVNRKRLFTTRPIDEPLSSLDNGSTSNDDCNSINRRRQHQKHIPSPTWSIRDLELTSTHPPLPQEEFERLARLVLIDVSSKNNENNNDNYNDEMDTLRQDLGNMLHMIQHVTEYKYSPSPTGKHNNEQFPAPTYGGRIYDTVRGVKAIPLRKGITGDPFQDRDATQAREVWEIFLRPKTVRKGGSHVYFAIETSENKLCK